MSRFLRVAPIILTILFLASCKEEEEIWPNYEQALACVKTNGYGQALELILDDGTHLRVTNYKAGLRADTTYRALTLFQRNGTSAWLSDFAAILAPPVLKYPADKVRTDPVGVTALWKSGDYINLRLAVRGSVMKSHLFGFHRARTIPNEDGSQTMVVRLIHYQNEDPLYYTREAYLSLPFRPLIPELQPNRDSIRLEIQSFDEVCQETFAL